MKSSDRGIRRGRRTPTGSRSRWMRVRPIVEWTFLVLAVGSVASFAWPAQGQQSGEAISSQGPDLYQRTCASCHGNQGGGTFRGPSLIGVGAASADYWLRSGRMPLREPDQSDERGPPAFSDAEIRTLVTYVAQLGRGPAIPALETADVDLAQGGELYGANCASCHNWDGKGGAMVNRNNAAPLHRVPNLQVAEAVRVGPGTMPRFNAAQLDDQQLTNVVAYVDYLRSPQDAGGYGLAHWGPSTETIAGFIGVSVLVGLTAWLGERRRG